jgi:hypothetical protein
MDYPIRKYTKYNGIYGTKNCLNVFKMKIFNLNKNRMFLYEGTNVRGRISVYRRSDMFLVNSDKVHSNGLFSQSGLFYNIITFYNY